MWRISQSWSLLALVCFVATPGTEALSFVEIQGPNFKGQLRYEVQRSKDACLSDCYLFEDCVIVAINTAGMHFYARCGDPDVPKDLKKVCKNTTLEDYLYLPEGIVDPQLQYTDMNIPIYAHQTDCTSSSTATGVDCLEDCNSLISLDVIGMVP
ncbi:unnamed protein product [Nippostrongylus brasiliensis]|uniref:Apple domain-containing protein n=1 Tax=Nippostrongylus brasiliensis TaxID=27835 RepID=A0A0N4XWR6_NIPBR|nr:unnamed protein product [Nippostrongylus brasiliensis]